MIKDEKLHQEPVVVLPNSGEQLKIAGSQTFHKIKSSATNGVFSVIEFVTPPGKVSRFMFMNARTSLFTSWKGKLKSRLETKR
jgi:hypothetical protein